MRSREERLKIEICQNIIEGRGRIWKRKRLLIERPISSRFVGSVLLTLIKI
jgi:hypothetical protein